jgi:hypothetical protein
MAKGAYPQLYSIAPEVARTEETQIPSSLRPVRIGEGSAVQRD